MPPQEPHARCLDKVTRSQHPLSHCIRVRHFMRQELSYGSRYEEAVRSLNGA